ncbi:MAG: response regulator [Candidatus Methylomirabilia bacterium]
MRILLAEDDRNFGRLVDTELSENGHEVDLVTDGVEAVLRCIDREYDFALLDIKMPRLDGINALRIIKRLRPGLPAITYSGNAGSGEMAESIRAGAVRCLTKPLSIARLLEEIEGYAARRQRVGT